MGEIQDLLKRASEPLGEEGEVIPDRIDRIEAYKSYRRQTEEDIRKWHNDGMSGFEVARARCEAIDHLVRRLYSEAIKILDFEEIDPPILTLIADGGYGRGVLNPGSDIDLLFLVGKSPKQAEAVVENILYMLWDIGFQVGHATRNLAETIKQANADNHTKSALIEARFLVGDPEAFSAFQEAFYTKCVKGQQEAYLAMRREDLRARRSKYHTVFLQEPHVKNGSGGLRDYHNLIWICFLEYGVQDPERLVAEGILSKKQFKEIREAYDFLLRVRNELHYETGRTTDILTLRYQGIVSTNLGYDEENILRRCETFMKDYYQHTRALFLHSTQVMESLHLDHAEEKEHGLVSFLTRRKQEKEAFDDFYSWNRRIYPDHTDVFIEQPFRLMRFFQHMQQRNLKMSPQAEHLVEENLHLVNERFRKSRKVAATFEAILSRKGEVGNTLKMMHRTGFLGAYLPEFGALTCLVQHEFFHRYTADHHTLMCLHQLDRLTESKDSSVEFYQGLWREEEDPFVIHLAMILHDTGRAENMRYHTDASTVLADEVCIRLGITGERRRLLMFLVDHHLTFWRTATTKNIEDPKVVAEFAQIMKSKRYLAALFVFTYADSMGTNEEAWSEWKATLMRQLYSSTLLYWKDKEAFQTQIVSPNADLRKEMHELLGDDFKAEIETHFKSMPARYFYTLRTNSLKRHLELVRTFFEQEAKGEAMTTPAFKWHRQTQARYSEFNICTWNRALLAARLAGILAAHEINILSADLYVRDDKLALNFFRVCTTDLEPIKALSTKNSISQMMKTAFASDSFDLEEPIAATRQRHSLIADELQAFPQRVFIDQDEVIGATLIEIQAVDRLGLLYDCFSVISEMGFEILHARISTEKGAALDNIHITMPDGSPLQDPDKIATLQKKLEAAIGIQNLMPDVAAAV